VEPPSPATAEEEDRSGGEEAEVGLFEAGAGAGAIEDMAWLTRQERVDGLADSFGSSDSGRGGAALLVREWGGRGSSRKHERTWGRWTSQADRTGVGLVRVASVSVACICPSCKAHLLALKAYLIRFRQPTNKIKMVWYVTTPPCRLRWEKMAHEAKRRVRFLCVFFSALISLLIVNHLSFYRRTSRASIFNRRLVAWSHAKQDRPFVSLWGGRSEALAAYTRFDLCSLLPYPSHFHIPDDLRYFS